MEDESINQVKSKLDGIQSDINTGLKLCVEVDSMLNQVQESQQFYKINNLQSSITNATQKVQELEESLKNVTT